MPSPQSAVAKKRIQDALVNNSLELDLSGLGLCDIPPWIGELRNLKVLSLYMNQLTSVPREIVNLKKLIALYLDGNKLITVPREFGNLSNLKRLYLHNNQLTDIPNEIGKLASLEVCYIQDNNLEKIPKDISELARLNTLFINNNQLELLPKELGNLKGLRNLHLHNNNLTDIPKEIGRLSELEELYLHENQLSSIPKELGSLTNLRTLYLQNNQLRTIPKEIKSLSRLENLYICENRLQEVPLELGKITSLKNLHLYGNCLTIVPIELGNLKKINTLYLFGNHDLKFPPPEVIEEGTQAVLSYLQSSKSKSDYQRACSLSVSTERELKPVSVTKHSRKGNSAFHKHSIDNIELIKDSEFQWVSKLLIVGEGGVGKTSLIRSLKDEVFKPRQSSTHGIEISSLALSHPIEKDVTMTLNVWDFGGQEIYHATHQFFLTDRSLFLLAFNARLGFGQGKLIYWLKTICANAPTSPVLLVSTHADERDADLPLTDLKQQFPQIVALHEISNITGQGITKLRNAIAQNATQLPLMGEMWPAEWLSFAENIRHRESIQTTPQHFWDEMGQAEIPIDGRPVLANWLHELGDILFFQDDDNINDLVIFKPQWVTENKSKV